MMVRVVLVLVCVGALCSAQERRAPSMGFMGMRGKKDLDLEEYKRAPAMMGFQGVRGKKLFDEGEEVKRAPAMMGFQGVRGKKEEPDKRAPSMGFMGMRGKKDYDYPWLLEEDKRAPSGFFGMRGKKGPSSSGFFGMRGKKGPSSSGFFGMRGKKVPSGFMGVRGKKDGPDDIDSLLQLLQEAAAREELEGMMDSRAKRFMDYTELSKDEQPLDSDLL